MTPELIAIITVGIGLAGLILRQGQRLGRRIDRREEQMNERFAKLERRMAAIKIQQAKPEGLPEGLREAVSRPRAA